jgi:hypothetical protein
MFSVLLMLVQVLEELAITVQQNLISKLPFCAFNGGNDVFVDVGNKSIGLDALMRHLDCYPFEVRRRVCLLFLCSATRIGFQVCRFASRIHSAGTTWIRFGVLVRESLASCGGLRLSCILPHLSIFQCNQEEILLHILRE